MRSHAKAASAGPTSGRESFGSIRRGAAVADASRGSGGRGASAIRRNLSLAATVAVALLLFSAPSAWADPPAVSTDGVDTGVSQGLTTLEGSVDPNGLSLVSCEFLYGETSDYEASIPCAESLAAIGSGTDPVPVSATTAPLEPNTTYHFRLRASSSSGTSQGKDRTFTTTSAPADGCPNAAIRAEQGIGTLLLPDCMALEQVSPPVKRNQHARMSGSGVSVNGERVAFDSPASLAGAPVRNSLGGETYIASRGPSGWSTVGQSPPFHVDGLVGDSFTPDFSHWLWEARDRFYRLGLDGSLLLIAPPLTELTGKSPLPFPRFLGVSADHSHVFMATELAESSYLPGDPVPKGTGEDENVYVSQLDSLGQPTLELFARDRDGKVWGGNCGVRIGGIEEMGGSDRYLRNGHRNQGAISADGSRVYFSTRADHPAVGDCGPSSKMRIMVREETPTGPKIEELIENECDRVSPPCSTHVGEEVYQGASVDQSLVYFNTNRQLAATDFDGSATSCNNSLAVAGCDLYVYDSTRPEGERLTQVSAGEATASTPGVGASVSNGITAISADGSRAYFIALSVLTTDPNPEGDVALAGAKNLYAYDHADGDLAFVGTLDNAEAALSGADSTWSNDAYPVPIVGTDSQGNEVGGDGHILVFRAKAALTADDTDTARDIYRYNADAGTLDRISKAGPGGSDSASIDVTKSLSGNRGTDYAERGRWVSEDGETIVFATKEALLAGDINGLEDAYMWREGQLYRLPGSTLTAPTLRANNPSLSHDGSTIAYHGTEQLLPSDGDTVQDVYVARVNGGYPTPVKSVCQGEACQGAPGTLSDEIGATTGLIAGAGNATSQGTTPRRCPKGKRAVRRGGKARCVAKRKSRANSTHKRKRASRKQGGQK